MTKITGIVLTYNEEQMIADCLDSLSFCDEIIVIDSLSSDRTPSLAEHMGAQVTSVKGESFAEKRNMGLKKAKGDWLLYLDADERITPKLRDEIKKVIDSENQGYSAYKIPRQNFYFGDTPWPQKEMLERLFKKKHLLEWYGDLHESPRIDGSVGELHHDISHFTHRDLTSMLKKTIEWSKIEAKLRFDAHHPPVYWWRFPRVMLTAFINSYIKQKGYKVGTVGLLESIFQSFSSFITYARLWELQSKSRNNAEPYTERRGKN